MKTTAKLGRFGVTTTVTKEVVTYPFDRWLEKPQAILKRGIDYGIESRVMVQQIRNKAIELGLTVSFKIKFDMISLTVWDRIKRGKST